MGVARQYCGTLGKVADIARWPSVCTGAVPEASCPLSWRLYLPQESIEVPERAAQLGLPEGMSYQSKTELALELIDEDRKWQVPVLPVIADSGYGNEFDFRQHLRQRHLPYAVGVRAEQCGLDRRSPSPVASSKTHRTSTTGSSARGGFAADQPDAGRYPRLLGQNRARWRRGWRSRAGRAFLRLWFGCPWMARAEAPRARR